MSVKQLFPNATMNLPFFTSLIMNLYPHPSPYSSYGHHFKGPTATFPGYFSRCLQTVSIAKKKYFYSVCICVYMYIYINNCKFLLVIFLWLSSWNVCVARHVCDGMYGFNLIIILCCAKLHIYVNLDDCSSWQLVSVSVHL